MELVSGRFGLKSTINGVTASKVHSLLKSQFRVSWRAPDGTCWVFVGVKGRKLRVEQIGEARSEPQVMSIAAVDRLFRSAGASEQQCIIVEAKLMTMQGVRSNSTHSNHGSNAHGGHDHPHEHLRPTTRLLGLLRLEFADVLAITIFGLAAGLLGLASPLAVEWSLRP